MYACSPKWEGWISRQDLHTILEQLAATIHPSPYGPDSVSLSHGLHFTGGEPFINFNLLLEAVEIANKLRIPSTFVETNCFWCTNDDVTRKKLLALKKSGLKGIMISVNPYYLEYIPFEQTERCVRIASQIFGENTMVYQIDYYVRFRRIGITGTISVEDYIKSANEELARGVELFAMGRTGYKLSGIYHKYPAEAFLNESCYPPFLRNWHNHFDFYGNYFPGFCCGISLGDCRELDRLLNEGIDLEKQPILGFLVNDDFKGLLGFAEALGYEKSTEGYISKCHVCTDIRKHLSEREEFEELKPSEFYKYLDK